MIISDNWNPSHDYGPFTESEAKAIVRYVEEGAGLYMSAGTLNNGPYPELQIQVEYLAPLVGLSPDESYSWGAGEYGPLYFDVPDHPLWRDVS